MTSTVMPWFLTGFWQAHVDEMPGSRIPLFLVIHSVRPHPSTRLWVKEVPEGEDGESQAVPTQEVDNLFW